MISIAGALGSIPYVAMALAAGLLWNSLIENPAIRREARAGYATAAELAAAKAQGAEQQRQALAGIAAAGNLAAMLREQAADLEKSSEAREKELSDYAAKIKRDGRSCPLSADDIRRLQR